MVGMGVAMSLSAVAQPMAPLEPPAVLPQWVLAGEIHDAPAGHAARLAWLTRHWQAGWRPVVVMEQFDQVDQAALSAAQAACQEAPDPAGCVLSRVGTDAGWPWDLYRPLLTAVMTYRLPLVAGNLSRAEAMALARGQRPVPEAVQRVPAAWRAAVTASVAQAHAGHLPADWVPRFATAQLARDAALADAMRAQGARSVLLIAGNGHVRRDQGVPRWLGSGYSIGAVPAGSVNASLGQSFDAVWVFAESVSESERP